MNLPGIMGVGFFLALIALAFWFSYLSTLPD